MRPATRRAGPIVRHPVDKLDAIEVLCGRRSDPEYARQMEQELAAEPDMPWENFDVGMLDRYVGPISWEIRSREDGFVVRYMVLAPDDD